LISDNAIASGTSSQWDFFDDNIDSDEDEDTKDRRDEERLIGT
jgi:hypothetical protein